MRITYAGPHDGVEIASLNNVVVERGQTIEVDDDLAVRLVVQRGWDADEADIAAWVGDDAERAKRLLVAELHGQERPELVARLALIADPPRDSTDDEVPAGTADEVLAWVHADPEQAVVRANRALMAELSGKNRAGLKAQLERLATGHTGSSDATGEELA